MRQGAFLIYLLNHNSLSHQTWPINWYKQGQEILGIFRTIWRTGATLQIIFNLATCSNYSTNSVRIPVFHFFEKVNKGQLKVHQQSSSSQENNMLKISHWNTFYFLRYANVRYVKNLFTNIQKQKNILKISLLFKKFTNFTDK